MSQSTPVRPAKLVGLHVTPGAILFYRVCDEVSGLLLSLMVVFSPWAFGTTQTWSKWIMTATGLALGGLYMAKLSVRLSTGYQSGRWLTPKDSNAMKVVLRGTAILTVLVIGFCFVSALNARATYQPRALSFEYHEFIPWLPHSFDSGSSWRTFWEYLGLGLSFWAARDWLLGKSTRELRAQKSALKGNLPDRARQLLWLLTLNGLLLALEGIVQRVEGSGKLLFLVQPRVNPEAVAQFGPWAYRANAASYFNLLWPLCIGFWWTLHRTSVRGYKHHFLLVCAAVMAACPIISTSRGGALVTAAMLVTGSLLLVLTQFTLRGKPGETWKSRLVTHILIFLFMATAVGIGGFLGWKQLSPRMAQLSENYEQREAMYDTARPMAQNYPLFGTGPGTFATVFQLYRISNDTYWPAQLHNDYLETVITFGWLGTSLLVLTLALVLARYFVPGGLYGSRRFVMMCWLALGGCLVHARWDFPFQIHSIVFLFLLISAILFTLSRRPS